MPVIHRDARHISPPPPSPQRASSISLALPLALPLALSVTLTPSPARGEPPALTVITRPQISDGRYRLVTEWLPPPASAPLTPPLPTRTSALIELSVTSPHGEPLEAEVSLSCGADPPRGTLTEGRLALLAPEGCLRGLAPNDPLAPLSPRAADLAVRGELVEERRLTAVLSPRYLLGAWTLAPRKELATAHPPAPYAVGYTLTLTLAPSAPLSPAALLTARPCSAREESLGAASDVPLEAIGEGLRLLSHRGPHEGSFSPPGVGCFVISATSPRSSWQRLLSAHLLAVAPGRLDLTLSDERRSLLGYTTLRGLAQPSAEGAPWGERWPELRERLRARLYVEGEAAPAAESPLDERGGWRLSPEGRLPRDAHLTVRVEDPAPLPLAIAPPLLLPPPAGAALLSLSLLARLLVAGLLLALLLRASRASRRSRATAALTPSRPSTSRAPLEVQLRLLAPPAARAEAPLTLELRDALSHEPLSGLMSVVTPPTLIDLWPTATAAPPSRALVASRPISAEAPLTLSASARRDLSGEPPRPLWLWASAPGYEAVVVELPRDLPAPAHLTLPLWPAREALKRQLERSFPIDFGREPLERLRAALLRAGDLERARLLGEAEEALYQPSPPPSDTAACERLLALAWGLCAGRPELCFAARDARRGHPAPPPPPPSPPPSPSPPTQPPTPPAPQHRGRGGAAGALLLALSLAPPLSPHAAASPGPLSPITEPLSWTRLERAVEEKCGAPLKRPEGPLNLSTLSTDETLLFIAPRLDLSELPAWVQRGGRALLLLDDDSISGARGALQALGLTASVAPRSSHPRLRLIWDARPRREGAHRAYIGASTLTFVESERLLTSKVSPLLINEEGASLAYHFSWGNGIIFLIGDAAVVSDQLSPPDDPQGLERHVAWAATRPTPRRPPARATIAGEKPPRVCSVQLLTRGVGLPPPPRPPQPHHPSSPMERLMELLRSLARSALSYAEHLDNLGAPAARLIYALLISSLLSRLIKRIDVR